jgi:hypothetical protein
MSGFREGSQRGFRITINDDGTVTWQGVDAGKTTVFAMSEKEQLITLHIAGGYWWDNGGRHYGETKVSVHRFEYAAVPNDVNPPPLKPQNSRELILKELHGVMSWKPRGNKWTPEKNDDDE